MKYKKKEGAEPKIRQQTGKERGWGGGAEKEGHLTEEVIDVIKKKKKVHFLWG